MTTPIISYPPVSKRPLPDKLLLFLTHNRSLFLKMRGGRKEGQQLHCPQNLLFPLPLSKYLQYSASSLKALETLLCERMGKMKIGLTFPVLG